MVGGYQYHRSQQFFLLFLIIFAWTPPHFWALAIHKRDEYAKVDIPMLPVTHGVEFTRLHVLRLSNPVFRRCFSLVSLVIINGLPFQNVVVDPDLVDVGHRLQAFTISVGGIFIVFLLL